MNLVEGYEVLESVAVGMDPVLDGFTGVLFELIFDGERYAFSETASGSGNRLLRFRSRDRELAYAFFEAELSQAVSRGDSGCTVGLGALCYAPEEDRDIE